MSYDIFPADATLSDAFGDSHPQNVLLGERIGVTCYWHSKKFAIKWSLNIPPHAKRVATL